MIVRLMGEGQFRVQDGLRAQLESLDDEAQAAADAGNESELDRILDEMWQLVQSGERLANDDLSASDAVIPPSDLTLEETKRLFSDEGLIPDLPS